MSWLDVTGLVIYLGAMTAIGFWAARRVKSMEDFVMPRRFGKVLMITFSFGTGTHADDAVSVSSKTFTNGLSGIWYQWLWLFCTPFYWVIAPVMRRFRAITTADVFEARYSRSVANLYTLVGIIYLIVDLGVMLKGSGAIITASTGGLISANTAIALMTVVFVTYGVAGGLSAAIITDFIQGILTVVFSFMLLPFVLQAVGGLAGIHQNIADPHMFSLVAPTEIGLFYIVMIALNGLIGIVTQPYILSNCAAGRTEMDGRVGFMGGNMIKRFCTIAWCLTGLAAVVYFSGREMAPDQVWGTLAHEFLPRVMPGLLGIFLAALLASVQSSADAVMIASAGLFTENLYKKVLRDRSQDHYLRVARVASLAVVVGAVLFAWWIPGVIKGLEIFWKIGGMMGIAFWLGLFWRRTTPAGAWAATLTALLAWWLSTQSFFISGLSRLPFAEAWRLVIEKSAGPEVYLPWQMVFYLAAGLLAGVLVSLLTKPVAPEKLENFYALTRTQVTPGEEVTAPCTLPKGAVVPPSDNLFPRTNLEIQTPSRTSVIGFLFAWAFVAGIILLFYLIAQGP